MLAGLVREERVTHSARTSGTSAARPDKAGQGAVHTPHSSPSASMPRRSNDMTPLDRIFSLSM
jgi:hypothetical protein